MIKNAANKKNIDKENKTKPDNCFDDDLKNLRHKIDEVDKLIIMKLKERQDLVRDIGAIKKNYLVCVYDKNRELEQNNKFVNLAKTHDLSEDYLLKLFDLIREESRKEQESLGKNKNGEGVIDE